MRTLLLVCSLATVGSLLATPARGGELVNTSNIVSDPYYGTPQYGGYRSYYQGLFWTQDARSYPANVTCEAIYAGAYGGHRVFDLTAADYCTLTGQQALAAVETSDLSLCYQASATLGNWASCRAKVCPSGYNPICSYEASPLTTCEVRVTVTPTTVTSLKPKFIVQGLQYAMPGNATSISYTDGFSAGSTWQVVTKQGVAVNVTYGLGGGGGGDGGGGGGGCTATAAGSVPSKADSPNFGVSSTLSFETCSDHKTSLQTSFNGVTTITNPVDAADHLRDVFSLWVNPAITDYSDCPAKAETLVYGVESPPWLIGNGQGVNQPQLLQISVYEALHPESVVDDTKRLFLTSLTADEIRDSILALDPFIDAQTGTVAKSPVLDPDRFRPIETSDGTMGPVNFHADAATTTKIDVKYHFAHDNTDTTSTSSTLSVGGTFLGMGASARFNLSYTHATQTTDATDHGVSLAIGTKTAGLCIDGQILFDRFLRSYVLPATLSTCPNVPGAPTGLTATAQGTASVNLAWAWADTTNSGPAGFIVERSTVSGSTGFLQVGTTVAGVTTWTDTGLTPGKGYWYRVRATNVFGPSAYSGAVSVTTGSPGSPTRLVGLSVDPARVQGGAGNATGTVTLSEAAQGGGAVIALATTDASVATVPAVVTVPSGQTSATFPIATSSVDGSHAVTITAAAGTVTLSAQLTVTGAGAAGGDTPGTGSTGTSGTGSTGTSGTGSTGTSGTGSTGTSSTGAASGGGGGCSSGGTGEPPWLAAMLLGALLLRRRGASGRWMDGARRLARF